MKHQINCIYEKEDWADLGAIVTYTCSVKNQSIPENADQINFVGKHKAKQSNSDVLVIDFTDCIVTRIPKGLTKIFPNANNLQISSSKLKNITREDLVEYSHFKSLYFDSNEIEFLPYDLFEDMENLENFSFFDNRLMVIEPGLLNGLYDLKYVNLSNNHCIDMLYHSLSDIRSVTLDAIKQEIYNKFSSKHLYEQLQIFKTKCKTGIVCDFMRVIENEKLKDFVIKVEDQEFKVHKLLLAARSPVFAKMIESSTDANELKLIDISVDVFCVILKFIYTDELPESNEIKFEHIFLASKKLEIQALMDFAIDKLTENVNAENAFDMLTMAKKFDIDKLSQKASNEVKKIVGDEIIDVNFATNVGDLKIKDEKEA